ncbi:MAG: hypothetical protein HFJ10_01800 [Lachnospiraceae bacterium]|nr:hypothetical protein [Lachnospiraceae bacterium]
MTLYGVWRTIEDKKAPGIALYIDVTGSIWYYDTGVADFSGESYMKTKRSIWRVGVWIIRGSILNGLVKAL